MTIFMTYVFSSNLIDHFLYQNAFIQYVNELGGFRADFGAKAVIYPPLHLFHNKAITHAFGCAHERQFARQIFCQKHHAV